jgi:hypothetical protein
MMTALADAITRKAPIATFPRRSSSSTSIVATSATARIAVESLAVRVWTSTQTSERA